jgi:flagellin-like hook-associated protein FlgL
MTNISNLGLTQILTNGLQSQQTTLSLLTQQLSSSQKYSNLTSYDPTDAHNILNFQNALTQRQSYISSITNVQARLTVYDSSMTDIESMAAQASSLASQNSAYSATTVANVQQQATNYLKQLTDDLNQQVGGRYIYSGTRYNTKPVADLSTLSGTPTATTTTSPALPSYDTNYSNATSFKVNSSTAPTGNFTVGNVAIPWSQVASGSISSVYLNGSSTATTLSTAITLPNTSASTATQYGANMAAAINGVAADTTDVPASYGISSLTASAGSGAVTLNFNGTTPLSVTPDAGGTTGLVTWVGGSTPDGTVAQTPNSSAAAYTKDSVLVDSSYSITYGVTSNDPSIQKLVNGLRYMTAAATAGQSGDAATYKADMTQATSLISSALSGIQTLHASVADNQNILTTEVSSQNADITSLKDQLTSIQQVDLTQVGTEINLLQTQMQASYSATASLQQLSLVKYL